MISVRVKLCVCEGCGCLFYRPQSNEKPYCEACVKKLSTLPTQSKRPWKAVRNG